MTNNTSVDYRKNVLDSMKSAHRGSAISSGLGSFVAFDRAREERGKYSLENMFTQPFYPDGRPYQTQEEFDRLGDEEKQAVLSNYHGTRANLANADAIREFASHPDEVLMQDGKYSHSLNEIASEKPILQEMDPSYMPLIGRYERYHQYRDLASKLAEGKDVAPQNEEQLREMAAAGAYKTQYEFLKGKYPDQLAEMGAKLASLAAKITDDKKVLQAGAEKLRDDAEKDLKRYVGEGKDYKDMVAEYVGKTLIKMIRSSDPEREKVAIGYLSKAFNGHVLGGQTFNEVFEKKKENEKS